MQNDTKKKSDENLLIWLNNEEKTLFLIEKVSNNNCYTKIYLTKSALGDYEQGILERKSSKIYLNKENSNKKYIIKNDILVEYSFEIISGNKKELISRLYNKINIDSVKNIIDEYFFLINKSKEMDGIEFYDVEGIIIPIRQKIDTYVSTKKQHIFGEEKTIKKIKKDVKLYFNDKEKNSVKKNTMLKLLNLSYEGDLLNTDLDVNKFNSDKNIYFELYEDELKEIFMEKIKIKDYKAAELLINYVPQTFRKIDYLVFLSDEGYNWEILLNRALDLTIFEDEDLIYYKKVRIAKTFAKYNRIDKGYEIIEQYKNKKEWIDILYEFLLIWRNVR